MVKIFKKSLALSAVLALGVTGFAWAADEVEVDVKVKLSKVFTATPSELNFGDIGFTSSGGEYTIDAKTANDLTTIAGSADRTSVVSATAARNGAIVVASIPNLAIAATYPATVVLAGATDATKELTLKNIATNSMENVTTDGSGDVTIYVGGTVEIPSHDGTEDWAQNYEGTVTVTLDFG